MANVGCAAITDDVGGPLVLCGVGVTGTNVARLKRLKVLEGTELVGHFEM